MVDSLLTFEGIRLVVGSCHHLIVLGAILCGLVLLVLGIGMQNPREDLVKKHKESKQSHISQCVTIPCLFVVIFT